MDESRKKYVKISDEVRKKMVAEFQESVKTEFRKDRIKLEGLLESATAASCFSGRV